MNIEFPQVHVDFKALQNKGIDLRCTIEEKLRQLQPATVGQVGHILKVGKHRLMSSAGLIEETVDNEYSERVKSATQTKSLLLQIENEFESIIGAVNSLSNHYDTLLSLLEKFRATCDDQLAKDADAEALRVWSEQNPTANSSNLGSPSSAGGGADFVMVSDPPPMASAANAPHSASAVAALSSSGKRYRLTEVDSQLASLRRTLMKASNDLKENVQMSCHPIAVTTRAELDKSQTKIIGDVTTKKTSFDLTKHRAQARGMLMLATSSSSSGSANTASANNFLNQLNSSMQYSNAHANPSSTNPNNGFTGGVGGSVGDRHGAGAGHSHHQLETYTHDDGTFPQSNNSSGGGGITNTAISFPANPTDADLQLRDDLITAKVEYDTAVTDAKAQLHFILEQTSMSTWACYNVFFQQMANYYVEVTKGNADLAKVLVTLKNQQSVAKQLTKERKAMIERRVDAVKVEKAKEEAEEAERKRQLLAAHHQQHHQQLESQRKTDVLDDFLGPSTAPLPNATAATAPSSSSPHGNADDEDFGEFLSASSANGAAGAGTANNLTNTNTSMNGGGSRQPVWGSSANSNSSPLSAGSLRQQNTTAPQRVPPPAASKVDWDAMFD